MASGIGLRARWERMTERERRLLVALGVTLTLCVVGLVAFFINDGLSTLESDNEYMRTALDDIERGRDGYQRAKAKLNALESRIGRGGVQLQGYLETAAKDAGVDIAEQSEQPAQPAGKSYIERAVELRIREVNLESLAKFLRKIETGPNLVVVTQLEVRTRDDKHERLEVEMRVATYEHAPAEKPKKEKKG